MATQSLLSKKVPTPVARKLLVFEGVCQSIVLLMGLRCAFAGRNLPVGADGIAYLDVARAYLRHDWLTAINGYWGPLYSWLLAVEMWLVHPAMRTEFAMARALNFGIFTVALYTFSRYWRKVSDWARQTVSCENSIPEAAPFVWIVLGYLLFLVNFVWFVDVVNPDILVAAIIFAIAAFVFKLNGDQKRGIAAYVWFGILLAIGYYAKAILLYFGFFVLLATLIQGFRLRNRRGPITACVIFVLLISPFVVALSSVTRHFSVGDSGKLNYAWFVHGPETKTWMDGSNHGAPLPFYPGSRIAFDSSRAFRVPSIPGVTYAPWYDAARFDKRSRTAFDLRGQMRQIAVNGQSLKEEVLGTYAALSVCLLILACYKPKESIRHFAATWFCTLPTIAVIGMYLLVHLVQRFVLGFSLVLWGAAFASVFVPSGLQVLARRTMLVGILVFAVYTMPGLLHYVISQRTVSSLPDMAIAEALPQFGVLPGDPVASLGDGQEADWAYLARVSVVAEVWSMDSAQFWSALPTTQKAILRSMAESGAKAVVWRTAAEQPCPPGWLPLSSSGCLVSLH